jgi:OOP family OmpA-OmpF porin
VCDGLDQCADTPLGARVDAKGCPADGDGDGVLDGLDQCADTPKGATVDALGCPVDSDTDGVPDGIDQCAGTQKGVAVDERGCPTTEGLRMLELMETGSIRVQGLNFTTGSANMAEDAKPVLDAVGAVILKVPTLNFEVGGHTDSQGSADLNRRLSESRAKSVRDYLILRYPEIKSERFSVRGYGSSRSIAPNTTEAGRAANRRVEFKVTNRDELIRMIREQQGPPKAPETPEVPIEPR